jgi:hypothetical protein
MVRAGERRHAKTPMRESWSKKAPVQRNFIEWYYTDYEGARQGAIGGRPGT